MVVIGDSVYSHRLRYGYQCQDVNAHQEREGSRSGWRCRPYLAHRERSGWPIGHGFSCAFGPQTAHHRRRYRGPLE